MLSFVVYSMIIKLDSRCEYIYYKKGRYILSILKRNLTTILSGYSDFKETPQPDRPCFQNSLKRVFPYFSTFLKTNAPTKTIKVDNQER